MRRKGENGASGSSILVERFPLLLTVIHFQRGDRESSANGFPDTKRRSTHERFDGSFCYIRFRVTR